MQEGRQLLAVMFTDIVGYTSLTAADEKHSLNLVETVNHKLKSCIESYHGEWVQQVGDGTLSTFVSAHDALTCAVAIQELLIANTLVTLDLGLYQLALGNLEESKRIFKQVLANDPKSFLAKRRLATTLVLLGEFEVSNTYFTEINVTNPTIQTLTNQGTALYYFGRFEDAAKVFKRAIELSQNDYLVFGNYAGALYKVSGLTTETKKLYLTAIDIALTNLANGTKDPYMALDLAHYHSQLGEYEQADNYFKQFEKNNSRSGDYYKAISFVLISGCSSARLGIHVNQIIKISLTLSEEKRRHLTDVHRRQVQVRERNCSQRE